MCLCCDDSCLIYFAGQALTTNVTLLFMSLSFNHIETEGAQYLADAVAVLPQLV